MQPHYASGLYAQPHFLSTDTWIVVPIAGMPDLNSTAFI